MPLDHDEIIIRRGTPEDAAALAELARRTFVDAFGDNSDPHDLALHTARSYGEPQQSAELSHPGIVTLIAEAGGRAAAYVQMRRALPPQSCVPDADALEIARFYVDQAWHGHGLAQRLMDAALAAARAIGARTIWLMVYEHNHRARAFYAKAGFREVGRHGFLFGNTHELDHVMMRELEEGGSATRG